MRSQLKSSLPSRKICNAILLFQLSLGARSISLAFTRRWLFEVETLTISMIWLVFAFWSTTFAIAMQFWVLFTHAGAQYQVDSRITSQCRSSTSTSLCTPQLLDQTVRQLKFRFEPTICIHALNSVSQHTGNISKGENLKVVLRRCSGYDNCMNGRKRPRILQSSSKLCVLISVAPKFLSSHPRVQ